MRLIAMVIVLGAIGCGCATSTRSIGRALKAVPSTDQPTIRGEHVKAIAAALEYRRADSGLSQSERELENFDLVLREVEGGYEVEFQARLAEGEDPSVGGSTSLGRYISYFVRQPDYKVIGGSTYK